MDKTQIANAIMAIGTQFYKLAMSETIDTRGFRVLTPTISGSFYASLQDKVDYEETLKSGGTVYTGKAYLYIADVELSLDVKDRFTTANSGSTWVVKSLLENWSDTAGYKKWMVERVVL